MPIRFLEPAQEELREIIKYYNLARAGLGDEFNEEVNRALDRIEQFPNAWSQLAKNVRVCQAQRFPYGLIDQPGDAESLIIAITHLHRRPGTWKKRLKP